MRIRETYYRECCQWQDLLDENDSDKWRQYDFRYDMPRFVWCKHCKAKHEYHRFTDAAGSMDWDYRKVEK